LYEEGLSPFFVLVVRNSLGDQMIKVETVIRDEDKNVQGGIHFYWNRTTGQLMFQTWEHKGSGPIWFEVQQESRKVADFLGYFLDNWGFDGYQLSDVIDLG
jgi:hypothetical protein